MRKDGLWPYHLATLLYLGFGAVVLYDRWGEVGSLFEPPGSGQSRLPLNSIGDVLAGFFAPLAFLWLFAATQLQRKELKLQREELVDTRHVLDSQRIELERSARESNIQTEIMNRTFQATISKNQLEEFNLRTYFAARLLISLGMGTIVTDSKTRGLSYYGLGSADTITQNDPATVDNFYFALHRTMRTIAKNMEADKDSFISKNNLSHVLELLSLIKTQVGNLVDIWKRSDNSLIEAKIENLGLPGLLDYTKYIYDRAKSVEEIEFERITD